MVVYIYIYIHIYMYMIHAVYRTTLKGRVGYFRNKHVSEIRVYQGNPVHTAFHRVCSFGNEPIDW